jgi:hypothetical protein
MVAGGIKGTDAGAVYIVDTTNQEMIVVGYDHNSKQLSGLGYRNLAADAAGMQRPRN